MGQVKALAVGNVNAMTANAFREDKEKCLAAGMNAHLAKPIKIENIKRILCEYCV